MSDPNPWFDFSKAAGFHALEARAVLAAAEEWLDALGIDLAGLDADQWRPGYGYENWDFGCAADAQNYVVVHAEADGKSWHVNSVEVRRV